MVILKCHTIFDRDQNFGRNWKYSVFIRVNIFAKSVNFIRPSKRKRLKLSKFEYCSLFRKVNFSKIRPAHVSIYSF